MSARPVHIHTKTSPPSGHNSNRNAITAPLLQARSIAYSRPIDFARSMNTQPRTPPANRNGITKTIYDRINFKIPEAIEICGKYAGNRLTSATHANDEITKPADSSEIIRSGWALLLPNKLTRTPEIPNPSSAIVTVRYTMWL